MGFVCGGDGEDKQEGEGRARDESEEIGVSEGEDIVQLESGGNAEGVDELGHELGVGFEGDECWCGGGGVRPGVGVDGG